MLTWGGQRYRPHEPGQSQGSESAMRETGCASSFRFSLLFPAEPRDPCGLRVRGSGSRKTHGTRSFPRVAVAG